MVHLSTGMKEPVSPDLRSEPAIIAGMASATLPDSRTPWAVATSQDYDRIRDTMAQVLDGFEDFNRRVRRRTASASASPRASACSSPRPAAPSSPLRRCLSSAPAGRELMLTTVRSHDQWNTTIYSNDDRYRGISNLRTLDLHERGRHARSRPSPSSTWST